MLEDSDDRSEQADVANATESVIDIVVVSDDDLNEQMYYNGVVCSCTNGDTVYTTDISTVMDNACASLLRFRRVQIDYIHEDDWPNKLEDAIKPEDTTAKHE